VGESVHVEKPRRRAYLLVTTLVLGVLAATLIGMRGREIAAAVGVGEAAPARVLWGIGDQLGPAREAPFYRDGGARMVSSWFNNPGDLGWMKGYRGSDFSDQYGAHRALELVVWLADNADYAVSPRFQTDIRTLTRLYKGSGPNYGPLYIVLFTEFETYKGGDPAYQAKLMSAYLKAVAVIHSEYDQARVALGFGGYGWDGVHDRDLAPYRQVIEASDFTAVQQMQACSSEVGGQNIMVPKIRSSVRQLGSYGKPVMISHFKLWGDAACQASAFEKFSREMFSPASLAALTADKLFAWGFMSDHFINDAGGAYADFRSRIGPHIAALPPSADAPTSGLPA
jgi:hypothetical protein